MNRPLTPSRKRLYPIQRRQNQRAIDARRFGLLEHLPDALFVYRMVEPRGFEFINHGFEALFGYSSHEVYDTPNIAFDILHPDDFSSWLRRLREQDTGTFCFRCYGKDGSLIWVEQNIDVETGADGKPLRVLGMLRDITHRRPEDNHPQVTEPTFDIFLDNSPVAFAISAVNDGRFVYINDALLHVMGYERAEVIGNTSTQLGFWEDPSVRKYLTRTLREQGPVRNQEVQLRKKNGQLYNALVSMEFVKFQGEACLLGMVVDISDRKHTEERLLESNQKLAALIQASPLGIISVDLDARVTLWNHSAEEIFGWTADEMMGQVPPMLAGMNMDFAAMVRMGSLGQHFNDLELRLTHKNGESIDVSLSTSAYLDAAGQVMGLIAMVADMRDSKLHRQALLDNAATARALLNASTDTTFLVSLDGTILAANDQAAQQIGWPSETLIGQNLYALETGTMAEGRRQQLTQVVATSHPVRFQDELDGKVWSHSFYPVCDSEGKVSRVAIFSSDVTQQRRAERVQEAIYQIAQAAYNADNLQALFRMIHETLGGLMPVDNFFIALYNPVSDEISFPYFVDQVDPPPPPRKLDRGITAYVLRTGKTVLAPEPIYEDLVAQGEVEPMGAPCVDWLGVPLMVRNHVIGVLALQSYTPGIRFAETEVEVLEFVSSQVAMAIERKRSVDDLRMSESRYRAILEDQTDYICRFRADTTLTFVNEALCNFYSKTREELIGQSYLPLLPEDGRKKSRAYLQSFSLEDPIHTIEHSFTTEGGEMIWVQWTDRALYDEQGNFVEFQSVGHNVTEQKQRHREMEAIVTVTAALRAAPTRSDMLPVILGQLMSLLQIEGAALVLYDALRNEARIEAGQGVWQPSGGTRVTLQESLTGQVIRSGQPYVNNALQDEVLFSELELDGLQAGACVPLCAQQQTIGAIWIGKRTPINQNDLRLLTAISDITANAMHRAALHEQTQLRLQRMSSLRSVDMAISASLDLSVTLSMMIDQITSQLGVHAADILLFDTYTQTLGYAAGQGFRSPLKRKTRLRLGEIHAGQVAMNRRMEILTNLDQINDSMTSGLRAQGEAFKSYIAVPLISKGQIKGVLQLFHRATLETDPEWLDYLQALAAQAAIAIDNAELFEKLQRSNAELTLAYDATIEGWSRALELRDQETEGHTRRVSEMTLGLIEVMGVSGLELEHVRRGALLHDIGKMAIPDRILLKPDGLDDDEWKIMKLHPVYAYELLSPIPYLRRALDIPYYHHEKWDGRGYPVGLKGEQIPLAARIFSVVDVWDALTSDRPYSRAWPEDKVVAYIKDESGKHFDPKVVDAFMIYYERFLKHTSAAD